MKLIDIAKHYALQPSTWLGLTKLGAAVGLYSASLIDPVSAVILGVFGLIDTVRKERTQQ